MMFKIVEKNGKFKRVEMTLEEREAEYLKALKAYLSARELAYKAETDSLAMEIVTDEVRGKDTTALKEELIAKQDEIKARYPKPNRADFDL